MPAYHTHFTLCAVFADTAALTTAFESPILDVVEDAPQSDSKKPTPPPSAGGAGANPPGSPDFVMVGAPLPVYGHPTVHNVYADRIVLRLPEVPADVRLSVLQKQDALFDFGFAGNSWHEAVGDEYPASHFFETSSDTARVFVARDLAAGKGYNFKVLARFASGATKEGVPMPASVQTLTQAAAVGMENSFYEGKIAGERRIRRDLDAVQEQLDALLAEKRAALTQSILGASSAPATGAVDESKLDDGELGRLQSQVDDLTADNNTLR